jgi:hypothetical protein
VHAAFGPRSITNHGSSLKACCQITVRSPALVCLRNLMRSQVNSGPRGKLIRAAFMDMSIPLFALPLAMSGKIDSGPARRSQAFRRIGIALLVAIILAIVIAVAVHETSAEKHQRNTSNGPAADPSSSSPNASHTLSDDMAIVRSRRISDIVGSAPGVENASAW